MVVIVVRFTTTCAISAYPHYKVHSIQHYVIKFVSDLQQVGALIEVLQVSSTNKIDHHYIIEILFTMVLNTIFPNPYVFTIAIGYLSRITLYQKTTFLCPYLSSYLLTLSIPDEGYSRNKSCALNWISAFLLKTSMIHKMFNVFTDFFFQEKSC